MKTFILMMVAGLLAAQLAWSNDGRDKTCRMSNEVFCGIPLEQNVAELLVHNSGRPGLCGVKILTNKNLAFVGIREIAAGLEASIKLGDRRTELTVKQTGNSLLVTDTSRDPEGILPPMFVIHLEIKTRGGESLGELVESALEGNRTEPGPVQLVAVPIRCQ